MASSSQSTLNSTGISPEIDPAFESWKVPLRAVANTFVGSLSKDQAERLVQEYKSSISQELQVSEDVIRSFATCEASDVDHIVEEMIQLVQCLIPKDKHFQFKIVMGALNTAVGTWLVGGGGYSKYAPFAELELKDRELVLLRLSGSSVSLVRLLFKAFMCLSLFGSYGTHPTGPNGEKVPNPVWDVCKYPGPHPEKPRANEEDVWRPNFINVDSLPRSKDDSVTLECDVVVVGSGAGGGVMAAELSQAGYKVILVEKGKYTHHTEYPLTELESFRMLYERSAGLTTECGGMQIMAGSCWGGGTAVNWSASLELPTGVREEWARDYGLNYFTTAAYQNAVNAVSERIGVSTSGVRHNSSNQILLDGCSKLGYQASTIPQNTRGADHECGYCTFGCPYGEKQSSHLTWIRDAAKAGCEFLDDCYIDKVLHSKGVAHGVQGRYRDNIKITIKSKKVVVSGGSVNTPILLMKSGLKNKHIGRHLRLHPVTTVQGVFPDKDIKPYAGAIMTAISKVSENIDGHGYGAKLEVPAQHPAMRAMILPWKSAYEHKRLMTLFPNTATFIVLTRDRYSEGSLWIDSEGDPRIDWRFSRHDANSMLAGVISSIKIMLAAGATEIITAQHGVPTFKVHAGQDVDKTLASPEFKVYIEQVKKAHMRVNLTSIFGAHQMGSCRMAKTASLGAMSPRGQSWEVKGLYVSDASLFPTASGVNPMLTTYSIAYSVAQYMKEDLKLEGLRAHL